MLIFSVYFQLTICPEGRKEIVKVHYDRCLGQNCTALVVTLGGKSYDIRYVGWHVDTFVLQLLKKAVCLWNSSLVTLSLPGHYEEAGALGQTHWDLDIRSDNSSSYWKGLYLYLQETWWMEFCMTTQILDWMPAWMPYKTNRTNKNLQFGTIHLGVIDIAISTN